MASRSLFLVLLGLVIAILIGCVSEIKFKTEASGFPVISGVISNSPDQRIISIFETQGIGEENKPLSASGYLYKDGNVARELEIISIGQLKLPLDYILIEGAEYYVEITTQNNRVFQSIPQIILPKASTNSLTWDRNVREVWNSDNSDFQIQNVVDIYANLEVEENLENPKYYRWEVSDTWLFIEIPRPFVDTFIVIDSERMLFGGGWTYDTMIVFQPDTIKSCYPTNDIELYPSILLETRNLSAGIVSTKIMSKNIDQTFLFKHYFSAFLHQIDERAFSYYQKAQGLVANQGSLYDEVPAALKGNVFDLNSPELTVLGYVEMSLVDTIRLSIEKGELNLNFEDNCRPRTGEISCKTLPDQKDTLRPCKCYDCEFVYGLETDIKPDFWEE